MGEYFNTEERAMKRLLEQRGYTIYEITYINELFKINGERSDIEFTVGVSGNPEIREGDSLLGHVIKVIDNDTANVLELMTSMKEKKEFKSKQYANKFLIEMFEKGINEEVNSCINSQTVGRKEGKTSTVTYMAQKYNLPIVVSNNVYKNLFKKIDENLEVYHMNSLVSVLNTKIVLVDELEVKHMLHLTEMGYVVIGTVR